MATAADRLLDAVIKKVKDSGLLYSGILMGTVSAVGSDGTITVIRGTDTYPSVRLLSGYTSPAVNDTVEIMRTLGGWICLGALQTVNPVSVWNTVSMATGFSSNGNSNGTVQYRVVKLYGGSFVEWRGGIGITYSGNSIQNGGNFLASALPSSARPPSLRTVIVPCSASSSSSLSLKVDFKTDGTTGIVGTTTNTTDAYATPIIRPPWLSLNGVRYSID
ncbi:hypothetical protein [Streptomyces chattanoogensis]|uniref:hypothetical protein n=1 Tax=Streptomyces chattanoogensis TaxID=66876 RepID=UPI0036A054E4